MPSSFRQIARSLLPPPLHRMLACTVHRWGGGATVFTGNYASWRQAANAANGYDDARILERARAAMRRVKADGACFERDSIILPSPEYSFPALAAILRVAGESGGKLDVVDFGGALGSSYFQFRRFLHHVRPLRWAVVEQAHYVQCGRAEFGDDELSFHSTIQQAVSNRRRQLFLASSVLQYLPDPACFIDQLLEARFDYILLDRTAFHTGLKDRLSLQRNPDSLDRVSYPAWFFNEKSFLERFHGTYELVFDFDGRDQVLLAGGQPYYRGYLMRHTATSRT